MNNTSKMFKASKIVKTICVCDLSASFIELIDCFLNEAGERGVADILDVAELNEHFEISLSVADPNDTAKYQKYVALSRQLTTECNKFGIVYIINPPIDNSDE